MDFNPFKNFKGDLELVIFNAKFEFYHNNKISSELNDQTEFESIFNFPFKMVYLGRGVIFTRQISPFLFNNSKINSLLINDLKNTFFMKNILKFSKTNKTLNCSITYLALIVQNYDLDQSILNEMIFANLNQIQITGSLRSIQMDVLGAFANLEWIYLELNDAGEFFHRFGIEWLNFCNSNYKLNIVRVFFVSILPYDYPNEDFCLFANLDFKKNMFIDIVFDKLTCTVLWIIKNSLMLDTKLNRYLVQFNKTFLTNKINECNFEKKTFKLRYKN